MEIHDSLSKASFQFSSALNSTSSQETNVDTSPKTKETNTLTDIMHKKEYELSLSEKAIIQAIEKANKALAGPTTNLSFSIHKETKEIMVKVINSETQEVIREIPPEKVLDMVAKMMEMAGLLVDEKR
jgi:flagellar protein FlaG